jgi:hypothetical protein
MTADGVVRVTDTEGNVLMEQPVEEKTFSECVVKDAPIQLGKTSCKQGACYKRTYYILVRRKQST